MTDALWTLGAMLLFVGGVAALSGLRRRKHEEVGRAKLDEAIEGNSHLPASLYPVINPDLCIHSFSCLNACPEGDILGIIDERPVLVQPAHCIGHGKCAVECPVDAIRLVMGTSERGVDLPEVDEYFESSRPGVHVVGELGGMGLIRNAMTQGVQLSRRLAATLTPQKMAAAVDVAIVGSGPAGIATALGCREAGLSFRMLEQSTFGGTVAQYPRQKVVMSEVVELPLVGKFGKKIMSKEDLLRSWMSIGKHAKLPVEEGVKVTSVAGADGRFTVETSKGPVYARKVVLATGRRGSPRKLGCPGEDSPKVAYSLLDPDQYRGCQVLVVGGGDSALEAAIQLANESDAQVSIAYRGAAFGKSRQANRHKLEALGRSGRVEILLDTQIQMVHEEHVELSVSGVPTRVANDYVIACLGGELPVDFLKACDVRLRRYHGTALGEGREGEAAPAGTSRAKREAAHRRFAWLLVAIGALILAALWAEGGSYYLLPRAARLKSPLHRFLRPSGIFGHGVGIAATAVMMLNYLYALRKRWRGLKGLGDIRYWLSFHMFVGTLAPMVIAFHAAFQSNNQLATATAASMAVLVSTGLVGRFLVALVPQRDGKIIDLAELQRQMKALSAQLGALSAGAKVSDEVQTFFAPAWAGQPGGSLSALAFAVPEQLFVVPRRLRELRAHFGSKRTYEDFAQSVVSLSRIRLQVAFYGVLRRYLMVWRSLHVGLSLFMVLLILAHIGVSLYIGFLPSFGR